MKKTAEFRLRLMVGVLVSGFGLSLAGSLPAADSQPPAATGESHASTPTSRDLRASKVIGMQVRNAADKSLGKIDDLIVDVNNERVAYAVLAFGGTMGMGQKLFAYPLSLFQRAAGRNDELVLNVEEEKLKNAPGFERKNWPDWQTANYRSEVDRYFGPTVSPKMLPNQHLVRASELIGKNVDDRAGRHAGEIEDLVVNLGNAKVHYAVLDLDKAWSTNDKLIPLPLRSFNMATERKKDIVLNMEKSDLDMSQGFDEKKWPDVGDPAYQSGIDTYLGRARPAGQAGPRREQ